MKNRIALDRYFPGRPDSVTLARLGDIGIP